jgi:hypothetical protein
LEAFKANYGEAIVVWEQEEDPYPDVPLDALEVEIRDDQVVSVSSTWQPPAPPTPAQDLLAELVAKVDTLLGRMDKLDVLEASLGRVEQQTTAMTAAVETMGAKPASETP